MILAKILFIVLFLIGAVYMALVPDAQQFPQPEMARIVFYHVPSALVSSFFLIASGYFGWRFLRSGDLKWDIKTSSSVEVGTLFAAFTMATGILFSRVQWQAWWHNDPRQISFLIVLLIYLALIGLRTSVDEPVQKAKITAGYALASLLPAIFLIFVFPRLPQVEQMSLHPTNTIAQNKFDVWYATGFYGHLLIIGLGAWIVYKHRYALGQLILQKEEQYGNTHDGSAPADRTRRPNPVSPGSSNQDQKG